MVKLTPAFFSIKLHGMTLFDASVAVSTPTIVPAGAFWATVKLLIVIVMTSPVGNRADTAASLFRRKLSAARSVYEFGNIVIANTRRKVNPHIAIIAFIDGGRDVLRIPQGPRALSDKLLLTGEFG